MRNWGVGLAIENVTQFREILTEAFQAMLILVHLDLLLVGSTRWVRGPFVPPRSNFRFLQSWASGAATQASSVLQPRLPCLATCILAVPTPCH